MFYGALCTQGFNGFPVPEFVTIVTIIQSQ